MARVALRRSRDSEGARRFAGLVGLAGLVRLARLVGLVGLVGLTGLVGLAGCAGEAPAPARSPGATVSEASPGPGRAGEGPGRAERLRIASAVAVLRGWDERRASAYARGDPRALGRLYLPGSEAGLRDQRLLREYAERGLRVVDMENQLLVVRLLDRRRRRIQVEVTERMVRAVAERGNGRGPIVLPAADAATRTITLVRGSQGWRVSGVRGSPR